MSLDAYNWAWCQRGIRPAQKLILLALADRAGENHCAFPSIQRLEHDTELNRKTIIEHLGKLNALGFIRDTGRRVGRTKQIIVWQLIGVRGREEVSGSSQHDDNAPVKQSRKRNSPENGTVPFFPSNSPVFSDKQSRKRDTESPIESTNEPKEEISLDISLSSQGDNSPPVAAKTNKIPYLQLVEAYHEILPDHPRVKMLTSARKRSLKARWLGQMGKDMQAWRAYLEYVSKSAFLCGRCDPPAGRRLFVADLDWLIKEGNAVKIYEGKYHG